MARGHVVSTLSRTARTKAARELTSIFDSKLFKALCEPARVEIMRFLTVEGRSDVRTIAEHLPQDASVVSRHLAVLHGAGILRRCKEGRHVFFEVDGPKVVGRLEDIVARFRKIVPLCCPGNEG
ncbi:MAG: winged helix-turn-helix transcriptional regulator [Deltaproteobacteria bacterium]|nr:winged helix-turn-helix transcriptional regulator [Deltaproteobacteria bacterium]